ncbi:hypothetical protein HELRODRAFT_190744 [Helobdella robusta]|uniref:Uncharacterized protein n=1 Tax=Helobdella robusta TaxID=6412 RepID=T1FS92_HELRO|nr:hypothetical protein HELRODRAFT_190744 [Helobdella robusta]ESO08471.1 hypothetical protein HELRODRAFT_190744 [Helobdella robusta]
MSGCSENLDTQSSFYVESGRYTTKYLRIVRICFTRPFLRNEDDMTSASNPTSSSPVSSSLRSSPLSFLSSSPNLRNDENTSLTEDAPIQTVANRSADFCSIHAAFDKQTKNDDRVDVEHSSKVNDGCKVSRPRFISLFKSLSQDGTSLEKQQQKLSEKQQKHQYQLRRQTSLNFPQQQHQQQQHRQRRLTHSCSLHLPRNQQRNTHQQYQQLNPNYVTFEPVMLSSGGIIGIPLFERLSETMKRAMLWLSQCSPDIQVISAETVPVRIFSGNQYGNHEVTYTWNRGEQKEFWLFVIRLYISGDFRFSPPDVLLPPFLLKKRNENCCHVS